MPIRDKIFERAVDVLACEVSVFVTTPDEFAAERPEVVAMPADGLAGQALVQQIEQERYERLNDLLAHGQVLRQVMPRPRPVL